MITEIGYYILGGPQINQIKEAANKMGLKQSTSTNQPANLPTYQPTYLLINQSLQVFYI